MYSIFYDTHYFEYSIIGYSFDNFLNVASAIPFEQQEDQDQQKQIGQESENIKNKAFPSLEEDSVILTNKNFNQNIDYLQK
ncbi:unnamed protein product [Paramecium sonneborni]|uniref:Uncharacterized protein n=1 Tax=Paramecium sonneborni TaxID=65129 RepID=A0A8S1RLE9_9CILI|nr:unnamed protein product [Paramecium sonneborni]